MKEVITYLDEQSPTGLGQYYIEREKLPHSNIEEVAEPIRYKLKKGELYVKFFTDNHRYFDENGKEIYQTGFYEIDYHLKNVKNTKMAFFKYVTRLAAIHLLVIGRIFPFRAIGVAEDSAIQYTVPNPGCRVWYPKEIKSAFEYMKTDFKIIKKLIRQDSTLERAIIWFYWAMVSNSHLDTFLNLFRSIEVLSEVDFQKINQNLNEYMQKNLSPIVYKKNKKMFRLNKESKFLDFMSRNGAKRSLTSRVWEYRNDVVHGDAYHYEFDSTFVDTVGDLREIVSKLIYKNLRNKNPRGFLNPIFEKDYMFMINDDTGKWLLTCFENQNSLEFDRKKLGDGHISEKLLGTLSEGETNTVLKDENIPEKVRMDFMYHMDRRKIKYKKLQTLEEGL